MTNLLMNEKHDHLYMNFHTLTYFFKNFSTLASNLSHKIWMENFYLTSKRKVSLTETFTENYHLLSQQER